MIRSGDSSRMRWKASLPFAAERMRNSDLQNGRHRLDEHRVVIDQQDVLLGHRGPLLQRTQSYTSSVRRAPPEQAPAVHGASAHVRLVLLAEVADAGERGVRRVLAQAAERGPPDVVAEDLQPLDVLQAARPSRRCARGC